MRDGFPDEARAERVTAFKNDSRHAVVTWALLTANVLVFVAAERAGGTDNPEVLLRFGAMYGPYIANGEYWRLFTAMFLHGGIAHLLFNGIGLFIFGPVVEREYGRVRFLTIYILAGLAGSVASFLFNSIAIGAGASGAIFGILGAFGAFFVVQRKVFGSVARRNLAGVLVLAGINLAFGLATPGIDNWAHLGGFVGGFSLGLALAPRYRAVKSPFGVPLGLAPSRSMSLSWGAVPLVVIVLLLGTWLATVTMPDNSQTRIYRAERYFDERDYEKALAELTEAIRLNRAVGEAYYLRALIYLDLGDEGRARIELGKAIRLGDRPTSAKAIKLLVSLRRPR